MELQDRVIVVTGAGRGIGAALCRRFSADRPAAVVAIDIDAEAAAKVADEVGGQSIVCDVVAESDIVGAVESIEAQFGRIDLFCANAGIAVSGGVEATDEQWSRVMNVNFMSHVYSSRAVLPGMISRGDGYLLHTASAAGLLSQIGSAPYAVSKHAAVALAEWISMTHGDQGIKVSCLCPQGVLTDMLESDDPVVQALHQTAISPEQVAEAVVVGLREEKFLILPHPEVATYAAQRAHDPDRWLSGMRRWRREIERLSDG